MAARFEPSRRACLQALGAAALGAAWPAGAGAATLAKVRERGALVVGLYHDMPPFHVNGQGIDVEIAKGLAESLGVRLAMLPFHADENMADDLRNLVWRGHYLGYGPADVLLHVPVDKPLMDDTPQAAIFAPYWRESVAIASAVEPVGPVEALSQLEGRDVAVPGQSLAGWLLLGADGGAYKNRLRTQWKDGCEAANALRRGEVTVAAGLASELQSVLRGDARFAVRPLPSPRVSRNGWAVGMAVKRDATDLAQALQAAVNTMAQEGRLARAFEAANVTWRAA